MVPEIYAKNTYISNTARCVFLLLTVALKSYHFCKSSVLLKKYCRFWYTLYLF